MGVFLFNEIRTRSQALHINTEALRRVMAISLHGEDTEELFPICLEIIKNIYPDKKEDYVFELLKSVYEKNNEICPYTLLDLNINVVTKNGFEFI